MPIPLLRAGEFLLHLVIGVNFGKRIDAVVAVVAGMTIALALGLRLLAGGFLLELILTLLLLSALTNVPTAQSVGVVVFGFLGGFSLTLCLPFRS